jgi:hypothetical protein
LLLGTLKAQDYTKLVFMVLAVVLSILAIVFGWNTAAWVSVM